MMKSIIILAGLVVLAVAQQRPPYAGSPNRYPQVLPQYLTTTVTNDVDGTSIVNRIGENSEANVPTKKTTETYKPYDFYNDEELLDRIRTWPKEKQPFWFVNREALADHLKIKPSRGSIPQRPSFAGSS